MKKGKLIPVIISKKDTTEKMLFKLIGIPEKTKDKQIMTVIFGNGKIMRPFAGKTVTKENVLDYVQILSHPCGCEMNWGWFDDMLLPHTKENAKKIKTYLDKIEKEKKEREKKEREMKEKEAKKKK